MIKKGYRYLITTYAFMLGLLSVLVIATIMQFANNYGELVSMKNCVRAVREFEKHNTRLPTNEELTRISKTLPDWGYRVECNIQTSRNAYDDRSPANWPKSGGWVLSYWRGSWNEYYSSWDDHYTLADAMSFKYYWGPFRFAPLLCVLLLAISCALRERSVAAPIWSTIVDPFLPRPDILPRELLLELQQSVERPLFNLWRVGMVVPLCFAAAYWIIIHTMFGGDEINTRSWCLLASGGCIAVLSVFFSRQLGPIKKLLWGGLTVLAYPLLFAGAMLIGLLVDFVHCFGVGWQ
jgi:hypothetical protein